MSKVLLFAAAALVLSQAPPQTTAARGQRGSQATASRAPAKARLKMAVPEQGLPPGSDARVAAVVSEPVQVSQAVSVAALLTARGVEPTPEAIGAIYDLNPTLVDVRNITADTTLVLPKLTGDPVLHRAIASGYRVRVTNEAAMSQTVTAKDVQLQALSGRISSISVDRFRVAADRTPFIRSLTTGGELVNQTLHSQYPLAEKVLRQTGLNAAILEAAARRALEPSEPQSSGPFANDELDQIDTTTVSDVEEAQRSQQAIVDDLARHGSGLGLVQVITLDDASNAVTGLRVTYAPKLDPSDTHEFSGLTSPVSETLVVGADFTLTVPGGDSEVHIRVDKTHNLVTFKIVKP